MPGQSPKKASDFVPYCEDQGMPYLAGAGAAGQSMQRAAVVAAGATYSFVFATEGLSNMENAAYDVFVQNNTTQGTGTVSNKTKVGFDIDGLTASDAVSVLIVGALSGQVV